MNILNKEGITVIEVMDESNKPKNWPITNSEVRLSNVFKYINRFKEEPTYKNKEILLSLVNQTDLNESDSRGLHRITDYEVMLINSIYLEAFAMQAPDVKIYLYRHIMNKIFSNKWASYILQSNDNYGINNEYMNLLTQLKLFALIYHNFIVDKDVTFAIKTIEIINKTIQNENEVHKLISGFNVMLYDLSFNNSSKLNGFLNFSREELMKIFNMQALIFKKYKINPTERPLSGIIRLTMTNWILRSRNNYNTSNLYKCISTDSAKKIVKNNEVWMQRIQLLNDKREGKVVKEIFSNMKWLKHEWIKNVDLDLDRTSFVSSFVRGKPNELMKKKYGKNIYAYKNDIIRNNLSPIYKKNSLVFFSYTITYDIIYSIDEFRNEINFLCDIINLYDINSRQKNAFFNAIIKYWLLSLKDKKWSYEQERRYEIFLDDDENFFEATVDDKYLKVKSVLFTRPDFIESGSCNAEIIKKNRLEKLNSISTKPFVFCNDCLYSDFDFNHNSDDIEHKCKNCNSNMVDFYNK